MAPMAGYQRYQQMDLQTNSTNHSRTDEEEEEEEEEDISQDTFRTSLGSARQVVCSQDGDSDKSAMQREKEVDIAPDVYGATTYSLIHDCREIIEGVDYDNLDQRINVQRFVFVVCSLVVNYSLQFSLLYFSYFFVAAPAVARVQNIYKEFHAVCFNDDGAFNVSKWNYWPMEKQDELCNVVFSHFWFLYIVLLLWWMTLLHEFRQTEWMLRDFSQMTSTEFLASMIEKASAQADEIDDVEERIVALTPGFRWALYLLLVLPKFLINLALLVVGSMWLAATDDFADLVLNAVALEFIILIDETVFDAMFPRTVKEHIVTVKMIISRQRGIKHHEILAGFRRSWMYYAVIIVFGVLYLAYGQSLPFIGILPGYADDAQCPLYWNKRSERPCGFLAPINGADCFPYGSKGMALLPQEVLRDMGSNHRSHRR